MGDQHYALVRTRIGETPQDLLAFQEKLGVLFRDVWTLKPDWPGVWVVYGKDFANCELEIDMPDILEDLSGILSHTAEIVWSWDHPQISRTYAETDRPRQRAWYIEGKND